MKTRLIMCTLLIMAVCVTMGNAAAARGVVQPSQVELRAHVRPASYGPVLFPTRQTFVDSFERSDISPWTTYGDTIWGIRDTSDTYGPQTPAFAGYRYAAHPELDIPEYPSPGSNPGYITYLESPTIDLTSYVEFYLAWTYWTDLEGPATNFDGYIVEISSDNGSTWQQVDAAAAGHLNPTYDEQLAGTGQLGNAWAYCYSTNPDWRSVASEDLISLGYVSQGDQCRIRFTFAYDALAGGMGVFVDDVYIGGSPPPDLQPPTIVHTPIADTTDTLNSYTVSAVITDGGTGVNPDSVILHYEIEGGAIVDVAMSEVTSDVYEADIPAQGYHTDIWYRIRAADNAGNWAQTRLYNFEVTNARTIQYDDGQPYWVPGGLLPGDGLFVQFDFTDVGIDSGLLHQVKLYFDGPGEFDLRIYQGTTANPGGLIDQITGLQSLGYLWHTEDITSLDIRMNTDPVIGYIIGPPVGGDTIQCLEDPVLNYSEHMWVYSSSAWSTPLSGGDHMIRLKVIPIEPSGVEEQPGEYRLVTSAQISPNPLRKNALIEYQLPRAQHISLAIYDVSGQLVKRLVDNFETEGVHSVNWNCIDEHGRNVASGVYFLELQTEDSQITKKALVIR
jgi:hypothetical protein